MNTFEKHYQDFPKFIEKIMSWPPDYVVPVAKKGCKLLKASNAFNTIQQNLIKYRSYFLLNQLSVKNKKIAIIDDATQFTATLLEYRRFFENMGAIVRTFSFVGNEKLFDGKRRMYDEETEIEKFLPEPVYQEYILQQSYYLLDYGNHFDLDHLIFEIPLPTDKFEQFLSELRQRGILLFLEDYFLQKKIRRFSLNEFTFFNSLPYFSHESVNLGSIKKLKFAYNEEEQKLFFSPLVFPTWDFHQSNLNGSLFQDLPFTLPFKTPNHIDKKNKGVLLQTYNNIYFTYVASLAKAFVQELQSFYDVSNKLDVKRNDLDATLGKQETDKLLNSVKGFLTNSSFYNFKAQGPAAPARESKPQFVNFARVIDDLKKTYEVKVRKKKTRFDVHYYMTYEELFERFNDKISLSEYIDYYCDLGVLVPETIFQQNRILRAFRTGEPNSDYNWQRTQILIPIAIEQLRRSLKPKGGSVDPMVLNKLLSNFVYDYPSDQHHELHCLIGEPYTFGTLVRTYHHHRAYSRPSIYKAEKISPYYRFDGNRKKFTAINTPEIAQKIKYLFDERQEIPFSEIITYFKLLSSICAFYKRVDVLNMLSICREENYFYSHILYNIKRSYEEYGNYLDRRDKKRLQALHESGKQASSAHEKIELARSIAPTMETIISEFGNEIEFVKAVERLQRNYHPFDNKFAETLHQLKEITKLQAILTNISLLVETANSKYRIHLEKLGAEAILSNLGISLPTENLYIHLKDQNAHASVVEKIRYQIAIVIDSLPTEEPLLATRLRSEAIKRAKNIATSHVYNHQLPEIVLLYLDFSGLRTIPEPKESVISRYYEVVERNWQKRDGIKLYGGKGGDDAFSILFTSVQPALQCAKDIKREFSENLFLRSSGDIKFGLCYKIFQDHQKESEIIQCWGTSKDCCEFKSQGYRNRGHLLASEDTIRNLQLRDNHYSLSQFMLMEGIYLKSEPKSRIYYFNEIEPL